MLLLIYFNPIIGPDLLYSIPEDISKYLSADHLDQIKRLMDAATPGFFTHAFSAEFNTANYFFMVPSAWARGKQEMVMITKIIEEESPNLGSYEQEFKRFVKKLKNNYPTIYRALYIHNPPIQFENEIKKEFQFLVKEFHELSKFFEITQAQTHGIIQPLHSIKRTTSLPVPGKIIHELENFVNEKENCFIVFQRRKDTFKIDIVPYDGNRVIKIAIIFDGQLSPEILREIGLYFQELKLKFLYTSGICQTGGKCIYEVYFEPDPNLDLPGTKSHLETIGNVEEVKIIEIQLEKINFSSERKQNWEKDRENEEKIQQDDG